MLNLNGNERRIHKRLGYGALASIAIVATLAVLPAPAEAGKRGFPLGVAAGELQSRSAKLWGHSAKPGRVKLEVAADRRLRRLVARFRLRAKRSNDGTVQKTVRGLKPGARYWYRFCRRKRCSEKGRFRTAPGKKRSERIEFALTGDADATPAAGESEPFFGDFAAFKAMRRERNDFNVFMGDTIYSDSGVAGPPALTVKQKWEKYRLGLEQGNLPKLRRSAPIYTHWDDHEFINDFSVPEDGKQLYKAGVRAFTDYAPVGYSRRDGLYRSFRWGRNVEVFFLDERSFRDAKADFGGTCDNPSTNAPDLAPTAPAGTRAVFATLIPSLSQPVSAACKSAINDPGRTLLGKRQLRQFLRDLRRSKARWKLVMNETPIQQFYGLPFDRWEGYAHERVKLLRKLEQRSDSDVVFFTTDTHAAFANVVRERTFDDDVAPANAGPTASDTPFWDFVIGPVATNTFWSEIDAVTGNPGNGELLSQFFFNPNPPGGVGMACAQGDQNSYAQIVAGKRRLRVSYKDEDGDTVTDFDGSACGPYVLER